MDAALHLVFASGQSHYALRTDTAAEVVNEPLLIQVPGSPEHVRGVFAHRGEIVPLVDLCLLVDGALESSKRAVLVRVPAGLLAFAARQVVGVVPVSGAPAALSTSGIYRYMKAPARSPSHEVTVIEAAGLWEYLSQHA